ncbi:MAG: class IV adenylate cyclase [Promethearchaeota archaeon]
MLEIEIKIALRNQDKSIVLNELQKLSVIDKKTNQHQCTFLSEEEELDYYFQHPCQDFSQTDEALRIRVRRGESSPALSYELTYKGAKIDSITKTRSEISVGIDSYDNMNALLSSLGFTLVGKVFKNRKSWKIDTEGIIISLDEVKSLGTYLELEIIDVESNYEESKDKLFFWLQKLLKREDLPHIERSSYLELLLNSLPHKTP